MYNACVYQQPPDVDLDTDIRTVDITQNGTNFIQESEQQAAWTNYLVWLTIKVMHFCFRSSRQEIHERLSEWHSLDDDLNQWQTQRPSSFQPIWVSQADPEADSPFPVVLLMTDWHGKINLMHPFYICRLIQDSDGIRLLPSLTYFAGSISTKAKIRNETTGLTGRWRHARNFAARFTYVWRMPEHVSGSAIVDHIMSDMFHLYVPNNSYING